MAKKGFKGLNMLVLGGGLLLVVLFFLGAYKVKEGFEEQPEIYTYTVAYSKVDKDKKGALQRITNMCTNSYEPVVGYTYNNDAKIDDSTVTYTKTNQGQIMATGTCIRTFTKVAKST